MGRQQPCVLFALMAAMLPVNEHAAVRTMSIQGWETKPSPERDPGKVQTLAAPG